MQYFMKIDGRAWEAANIAEDHTLANGKPRIGEWRLLACGLLFLD